MFKLIHCLIKVVLLLGAVWLGRPLTGVPMSPGYGGYQTATPPPNYTTTTLTTSYYTEAPKYYTTKAPEYDAITYASPSYYTDAPNYYSASSYTTKAAEYYTTTYAAPATTPRLQLLHRGSSLFLDQIGRILHRSAQMLLCPNLHSHN
jgi:hypothetical protein